MSRRDYYNDPSAPRAQRIVPAVTAFVQNVHGDVLMERRSDNGLWGLPGGVQDVGESIADTVVREVREETGIDVLVTGLVGIYTDPGHIIEFSDGETRQEFSLCFRASPQDGADLEPRPSSESREVRWISLGELESVNMSASTRRRLGDALREDVQAVIA